MTDDIILKGIEIYMMINAEVTVKRRKIIQLGNYSDEDDYDIDLLFF